MRLFYVVARDADGCDTAINQQLSRKEARQVFRDWRTDEELARAGAVRVQICDEATDECIDDEPVQVAT